MYFPPGITSLSKSQELGCHTHVHVYMYVTYISEFGVFGSFNYSSLILKAC